jgi:hypothetical protein
MLLSDADGADWKCSRSVLILTTCAPNRDVALHRILLQKAQKRSG